MEDSKMTCVDILLANHLASPCCLLQVRLQGENLNIACKNMASDRFSTPKFGMAGHASSSFIPPAFYRPREVEFICIFLTLLGWIPGILYAFCALNSSPNGLPFLWWVYKGPIST